MCIYVYMYVDMCKDAYTHRAFFGRVVVGPACFGLVVFGSFLAVSMLRLSQESLLGAC